MSVSPTDWQCCMDTESGLRCTRALIYGSHDGPHEHVHDYTRCGRNNEETVCGCELTQEELEAYARDVTACIQEITGQRNPVPLIYPTKPPKDGRQ